MLVSAVVDPSAFDKEHFEESDKSYKIQAEDLLKGIEENGILLFDSKGILRAALIEQIKSLPNTVGQQLQTLLPDLLKIKPKRYVTCCISLNNTLSDDLLKLAYCLKKDTKADVLIASPQSLETLKSKEKYDESVVPLSEYRDSNFEKVRKKYETHNTPIDKLPECEVKDFIIRSVRFSKQLRFYDPYIGQKKNTINFRDGIEYILSLWDEHGFFPHRTRSVKIYTCSERRGPWNSWKWEQLIQKQKKRIIQELIRPLKSSFPSWSIEFSIKTDPRRIFHARFLEAEHAIIGVDPGFDFFARDGRFKRTLFIPNMTDTDHLREYRDLPNVSV